jgi:hypothetical protein
LLRPNDDLFASVLELLKVVADDILILTDNKARLDPFAVGTEAISPTTVLNGWACM